MISRQILLKHLKRQKFPSKIFPILATVTSITRSIYFLMTYTVKPGNEERWPTKTTLGQNKPFLSQVT